MYLAKSMKQSIIKKVNDNNNVKVLKVESRNIFICTISKILISRKLLTELTNNDFIRG